MGPAPGPGPGKNGSSTKTRAGRWDSRHKSAFKSTFVCRQWTRPRKKAAGLSKHGKCMLCYAKMCRDRDIPC